MVFKKGVIRYLSGLWIAKMSAIAVGLDQGDNRCLDGCKLRNSHEQRDSA